MRFVEFPPVLQVRHLKRVASADLSKDREGGDRRPASHRSCVAIWSMLVGSGDVGTKSEKDWPIKCEHRKAGKSFLNSCATTRKSIFYYCTPSVCLIYLLLQTVTDGDAVALSRCFASRTFLNPCVLYLTGEPVRVFFVRRFLNAVRVPR